MIAECIDCTRLSSEGVHPSIASSSAAVLTTNRPVSITSASLFCCSMACSSSTGFTQSKEAQTVCPAPAPERLPEQVGKLLLPPGKAVPLP
jgi:hypothetical protein